MLLIAKVMVLCKIFPETVKGNFYPYTDIGGLMGLINFVFA